MNNQEMLILYIGVSILLFFILREIVLWYFKINKQIQIDQAKLALMAKQYEQAGGILTDEEKAAIEKALEK